jgi:UDP-GlcNAc:undecaprenyl-phosphate/decaprenyl-phosphate GlcNAc-1-phosphate transferase
MSGLELSPWLAALVAAGVSAIVLAILELARSRMPLDHPSERGLHDRAVARVGGIAIGAGFLPVALLAPVPMSGGAIFLPAWLAVAAVSIIDDWRGVRPRVRLGIHALAALAVAAAMFRPEAADGFSLTQGVAIVAAAFVIAGSANLYNFMDGSDGIAASMALCGFGAYGAAATIAGAPSVTYFALAAATVPFLIRNLPPARTFMGDGGSVPLGFVAAVFGIAGIRSGTWPAWFPLLVFLPFLADTVVTIVSRISRGENLFEAHKTHYYQRIHRMGAGHAGTLLFYGVLMAGTCVSAFFTLATGPLAGWRVLGAWSAAIGLLFAGIDYHWRKVSPGKR